MGLAEDRSTPPPPIYTHRSLYWVYGSRTGLNSFLRSWHGFDEFIEALFWKPEFMLL